MALARAAAALAAAVGIAGCGDDQAPEAGEPVDRPAEVVRVASSPAPDGYLRIGAENYQNETDVAVEVDRMEGERALAQLCAGRVAVAGLAGDMERSCAEGDAALVRVPLGYDAVAVIHDQDVETRCLTIEDLREIWSAAGTPPDGLVLLGPERDSPAAELFVRQVLREGDRLEAYHEVDDLPVLADELEDPSSALAFFGFEQADGLAPVEEELVAVDAGDGCVRATEATIRSREYPLSRTLYAYTTEEALRREPVVSFLRFLLVNFAQFGDTVPTTVGLDERRARRALAELPEAPVPAG